jgi:hypothetical protein
MERETGQFITIAYIAAEGDRVRVGRFSLHRSKAGDALAIDSASRHQSLDAVDDDIVARSQGLGSAMENFLCVPGQSADTASGSYAFSCDLERRQ